jgi:hypothetical protein
MLGLYAFSQLKLPGILYCLRAADLASLAIIPGVKDSLPNASCKESDKRSCVPVFIPCNG